VTLREPWTAVREAIQHRGQRVAVRLRASGWWELTRQPWLFWVGVGALLLVVIGVVWGMATGFLSVCPALLFFVALSLLVARIRDPSGGRLGSRIFEVLCWLAASYIPGYIIFALVTDLPRNQDLKTIRPFLASQTAMLAGGGQGAFPELKKAAGYEAADPLTKEDFVEICKRINPSGPAPMVRRLQPLEYATWIEFLIYHRFRSAQAIEKLFRYMTFLDSEHIRLITQIDNSTLFAQLDELRGVQLAGVPIDNTDLTFLAEPLFRYDRLTRQLHQYADRHLKGLAWSEPRD
jgi:hypothetical protein